MQDFLKPLNKTLNLNGREERLHPAAKEREREREREKFIDRDCPICPLRQLV
jgi:hypothetical protein